MGVRRPRRILRRFSCVVLLCFWWGHRRKAYCVPKECLITFVAQFFDALRHLVRSESIPAFRAYQIYGFRELPRRNRLESFRRLACCRGRGERGDCVAKQRFIARIAKLFYALGHLMRVEGASAIAAGQFNGCGEAIPRVEHGSLRHLSPFQTATCCFLPVRPGDTLTFLEPTLSLGYLCHGKNGPTTARPSIRPVTSARDLHHVQESPIGGMT